ncbi:hypothetical protein HJC23_011036 [Cyclotella cryptica]|uniref:Plastid lipid-associated protein/fibrillin conserved domain-containing protein n=1 Tax=Cyclotella cryptica TaxID=29204 RepID=A0ABD3PBE0_9STRA
MKATIIFPALLSILSDETSAFVSPDNAIQRSTQLHAAKGFGAPPPEPKKKSKGQIDREEKASKYDEIAATGGQEYRIFVRQFGSDDKSWLPAGSIAVPRGSQVSDALFANEKGLKEAIVRAYPKLKGMEMEFEYGFNLKIYPDDPIEVAMKGQAVTQGPSIGNWISNLLSPVDATGVARPEIKEG